MLTTKIKVKTKDDIRRLMPERHGNCYDLRSAKTVSFPNCVSPKTIPVELGVSMHLPQHYRAVLNARSSTCIKYQIWFGNGSGEIEADYSGVWHALFMATRNSSTITAYERIAQFHIEPVWDAPWYIHLMHPFRKFEFVQTGLDIPVIRGGLGSSGRN